MQPAETVRQFIELFRRDTNLQEKYAEAEANYPGSLELREAVVEELLLPLAEEAGYAFTVEDLRRYETGVYLQKHKDEEQDSDEPDDDTVFFLLERGWTNDAAANYEYD